MNVNRGFTSLVRLLVGYNVENTLLELDQSGSAGYKNRL